jgi:hypothetical protein
VKERLCFGCHKKQEWEEIRKRCDMREIFPFWLRLGSLLTLAPRQGEDLGIFTLLKRCRDACDSQRPETIAAAFQKLFLAGFGHLCVPRSTDEEYHGILPLDAAASEDSPLYLLTEGAALIRSLFVRSSEKEISLLKHLPPEFFSGRMLHVACMPYGVLDLEWSKKTIRRVHFHAMQDAELLFHFSPTIRRCRVRQRVGEKGEPLLRGDSLVIKSGSHYLLDRFEK